MIILIAGNLRYVMIEEKTFNDIVREYRKVA